MVGRDAASGAANGSVKAHMTAARRIMIFSINVQ
jgi:hypothetical protein